MGSFTVVNFSATRTTTHLDGSFLEGSVALKHHKIKSFKRERAKKKSHRALQQLQAKVSVPVILQTAKTTDIEWALQEQSGKPLILPSPHSVPSLR